jgi:hypothetical protein
MDKKYALIVGNTEYLDPDLAQLTAPGKDAEDFGRVLQDEKICGFDEVNVLLNQPEHIVRGAIDEFFDAKTPNDLLVLYFSGHGVRDELGSLYLGVKNTFRNRLRSTAIKSDYVREAMEHSRSKRQILILDCCNSGAFAQGTKGATGVSIGVATAFEAGYGRMILTASDSTQYAWEGDTVIGETDNSLFTHFLIEGLQGVADRDGDGCITVDELYEYAYEKVRIATPNQTPSKFSTKQQGEIYLRRNIPVEDIKPVPLPSDLIAATNSSLPYVREGAVRQLDELLNGPNIALARSAREALEQIAEQDDSRQISRMAAQALESFQQLANQKGEEEPVAIAKEEAERLVREKAEEESLAKVKADRLAREEADRLAAQKAEEERLAAQEAEEERVAKAKAEAERKAKKEANRLAAQKAKEEQKAKANAEAERQAREDAYRRASQKAREDEKQADAKVKTSHPEPEKNWMEGRWKWALAGFVIGLVVVFTPGIADHSSTEKLLVVLSFTVLLFFIRQ